MIDEKISNANTDILVSHGEHKGMELNGRLLQCGDWLELRVFGSWIPGQIARDTTGWYLLTGEKRGIRLRAGLTARFSDGSLCSAP